MKIINDSELVTDKMHAEKSNLIEVVQFKDEI